MRPITAADEGEVYVICRIGGKPEVRKHLEDLGFVVGSAASVVTTMGGNVIVKAKEARVAISRELARKILV